jgi:tetratricopeptide (TPR) repeat protein
MMTFLSRSGYVLLLTSSLCAAAMVSAEVSVSNCHQHSPAPIDTTVHDDQTLDPASATLTDDEQAEQFGEVSFTLSCAARVQPPFFRALSMLHSFEYDEARRMFKRALILDPLCAMAEWGVAMSYVHQLWSPPTEAELRAGLDASQRAVMLLNTDKGKLLDKERGLIHAIDAYYQGGPDHLARMAEYTRAMASLQATYPDDVEIAAFFGLALVATAQPMDRTFQDILRAGSVMEPFVARYPRHPGLTHYLIHAYDNNALAERGLSYARQYAAIAPASAHALHMPSHIFERLGMWREDIETNLRSTGAARAYAARAHVRGHWDEEIHGLGFLIYAYLQQGDYEKAREVRDYVAAAQAFYPENPKVAYVLASAPALYALERQDWRAAADLQLSHPTFPWSSVPWIEAMAEFARGYGAARLGDATAAHVALTKLRQYQLRLNEQHSRLAERVSAYQQTIEAWLNFTHGEEAVATKAMRRVAEYEAATAQPDGVMVPAAEMLGDMYLQRKQYRQAQSAYEQSLQRYPRRRASVLGMIAAASGLRDRKQREYYQGLLSDISATSKNTEQASLTLPGAVRTEAGK